MNEHGERARALRASVMDKVPASAAFVDYSDYARPAALWLVRRLLPTRVTPLHLTAAYTLAGAAAALLLARNSYLPLAGALLIIKSWLDAADGSLARARQRPSRVGRFADSLADFAVTAMLFAALGFSSGRWLLCTLAAVSLTLQCSAFSYYYVCHRAASGGDQTSRADESASTGYAYDNPRVLWLVHKLYGMIYRWQDVLLARVDGWLAPHKALPRGMLAAASLMGAGMQLLVIALCAAAGRPIWAAWAFVGPYNIYLAGLLVVRALVARGQPSLPR